MLSLPVRCDRASPTRRITAAAATSRSLSAARAASVGPVGEGAVLDERAAYRDEAAGQGEDRADDLDEGRQREVRQPYGRDEPEAFVQDRVEERRVPLLSDMDARLSAALRRPTFRAGQALRLKRAVLVLDRERTVRHVQFPVTDIPGAVQGALGIAQEL